ncbi:MAG: hypothetical protein VKK62_03675 [Synechococcaceae cyanobacterium]|nr:hypothetical protein [Synechococcaceae cyanobacterium]
MRAFLPSDQELPVPECYGQHGLFLVRHCYLLVAFHNGFETMAIGGTAQAVALQKGEVHPLFLSAQEITASQEPGALLEIDTPRHRTTFPQPRTPRTYWLRSRCQRGRRLAAAPRALQLSDLLDTPRRMEVLNRQLQRTGRPDHVPQPWDPSGSPLRWLMDRESSRCKRQSRRCSGAVLLIGWLLSLSLAAYPWTSLTLMLFSGLLLRLPLRSTGPKRRFLACRALAECLTVQDLWVSLGVERDVADLFDSRVDSGLDWVRTVLRSCRLQQLCRSATGPVGDDQMEESATMAHQWLTDELRWLERAEERLLLQDRWLTGSAVLALALSLLLAISPFLGSATGWLHPARLPGLPALAVASGPHLQAWLATAALITGVALLAWRHVLDPAPIRARYRRSRLLFQRALQAFDQAWLSDRRDPLRLLRLRAALEAVGQDKLAELNAWIAGQLRGVVRVDG